MQQSNLNKKNGDIDTRDHISKWNGDISPDEEIFTTREVAIALFNYVNHPDIKPFTPSWLLDYLPTVDDFIYLLVWVGILQGIWSHNNLPDGVEFPVPNYIHRISKDTFVRLSVSRVLDGPWASSRSLVSLVESIREGAEHANFRNFNKDEWYTPSEIVHTIAANEHLDRAKLKTSLSFYDQQMVMFRAS